MRDLLETSLKMAGFLKLKISNFNDDLQLPLKWLDFKNYQFYWDKQLKISNFHNNLHFPFKWFLASIKVVVDDGENSAEFFQTKNVLKKGLACVSWKNEKNLD